MGLIVKPFDLAAPGSWRDLRRFLDIARRLDSDDGEKVLDALMESEAFLLPRLSTDNGSDVNEAIERLSVVEMRELFSQIAPNGGEAVDPPKATVSSFGREGSRAARSRTG